MSEYKWQFENTKYAKMKCNKCRKIFIRSYTWSLGKPFVCLCNNCYGYKQNRFDKKFSFKLDNVIIDNIGKGEIVLMDNFTKAGKISDWKNWIGELPNSKGVYAIVYKGDFNKISYPEFIYPGSGGFFRCENPNVDIDILKEKWDKNHMDVMYVGRANYNSENPKSLTCKSTIKSRVSAYMKFGDGKKVEHRGGRYIWQMKDSGDLEVYYFACDNPQTIERDLINKFKPFANLKGGDNE